ncbi:MAG: hypothetical protein K2P99_07330 [Burkholderiales bacterium]|nr:hypothetical protein [Burkholderiales bacterium]
MKFIRELPVGTIVIVALITIICYKYFSGSTKLEKANNLCSIFYDSSRYIGSEIIDRFNPTKSHYSEEAGAYVGQMCFYGISHLNGGVNSSWNYQNTQLFNTNDTMYKARKEKEKNAKI